MSALLLVLALFGICFILNAGKKDQSVQGKLAYLEGVRGLAAASVVFCHFISAFFLTMVKANPENAHFPWEASIAASPLYGLYSATLCVSIFFTLSGFVLSYSFFAKGKVETVISSACRRYFRLGFPVLLTSAIYFLLMTAGVLDAGLYDNLAVLSKNPFFSRLYHFDPSLPDLLKSSLVTVFMTGQDCKYNFVLWTMFNELMGSFLVFSFLLLFRRTVWRYFGYIIFYVFSLLVLKSAQLPGFIMGMLLCDLYVKGRLDILAKPAVKYPILALALYLCCFNVFLPPDIVAHTPYSWLLFTLKWKKDLYIQGWQVVNLGSFLFLLTVLNSTSLQKLLSSRFCLFLGKISFSLYLIHYMFIFGMTSWLAYWLTPSMGYAAASIIGFVVSLPFLTGLSYVLSITGDNASIELGNLVYKKGIKPAYEKVMGLISPKTPNMELET